MDLECFPHYFHYHQMNYDSTHQYHRYHSLQNIYANITSHYFTLLPYCNNECYN